jgi:hypothetical protein
MTRITVDDTLSLQLGQVGQTVEICNSAGLPLGHFVPRIRPRPEDNCPYSDEELAEMFAETEGRPLAEFWKEIGAK